MQKLCGIKDALFFLLFLVIALLIKISTQIFSLETSTIDLKL